MRFFQELADYFYFKGWKDTFLLTVEQGMLCIYRNSDDDHVIATLKWSSDFPLTLDLTMHEQGSSGLCSLKEHSLKELERVLFLMLTGEDHGHKD
jgi:hypothetical protein